MLGGVDSPAPPAVEQILARTRECGFAMASERRTGELLRALAASKPGGRFLELGTGTGLSAAWLLGGMDAAATLLSVDVDGAVQAIAREALGGDPRLTLHRGDALELLRRLAPASFDFVFADAMPGKYEGLELALAVIRPGGLYVVDDLLPQDNWPRGHAAKVPVLVDAVLSNPRFAAVPLEWSSGILVAARR